MIGFRHIGLIAALLLLSGCRVVWDETLPDGGVATWQLTVKPSVPDQKDGGR